MAASTTPDLTVEDQAKIGRFAVLMRRRAQVQGRLAAAVSLSQGLSDATEELTLATDQVYMRIGNAMITSFSEEEVEKMLEERLSASRAEVREFEASVETIEEEMRGLRADLYGKFGHTAINLDFEKLSGAAAAAAL